VILALLEAFRQSLRDHGYVEGQNLIIEARWAEEREDRLPDLAADLVRLRVDAMVAWGGASIRAAQHATDTIPIVMAASGDPVRLGFVASLAHPGGNVTGLSALTPELTGKRLEVLKEAVPGVTRVAVLGNPVRPVPTSSAPLPPYIEKARTRSSSCRTSC
jgi:putative tryptophan/tyrosine transport system substrate-binding protein